MSLSSHSNFQPPVWYCPSMSSLLLPVASPLLILERRSTWSEPIIFCSTYISRFLLVRHSFTLSRKFHRTTSGIFVEFPVFSSTSQCSIVVLGPSWHGSTKHHAYFSPYLFHPVGTWRGTFNGYFDVSHLQKNSIPGGSLIHKLPTINPPPPSQTSINSSFICKLVCLFRCLRWLIIAKLCLHYSHR